MTKVGIITLFHENYNYGAVLQAFALQKAVEMLGYEAEIIDYKRLVEPIAKHNNTGSLEKFKKLQIHSKGDAVNLFLYPYRRRLWITVNPEIVARKDKFQEFYKKNMRISELYDIASIYASNKVYDAFICGSDQIWRPSSFDPNFYLDFVDESRVKFSYAASMGVRELSREEEKVMIPLIQNLQAVSVREEEAKGILSKSEGLDVSVVLDPTLLWDKSFWKKYSCVPENLEAGKYIFCYLIGENNKNREMANRIAKQWKLPLVSIPGVSRILPYDFSYADVNMTASGPNEFLGLIENAALIVTDSFHACVFSIIFEKQFYALERFKKSDASSMNGRIYDLLNMFSLSDRLISSCSDLESTTDDDQRIADKTLYITKKEISWKYLKKALALTENSCSDNIIEAKFDLPRVFSCQSDIPDVRKNSSSGGVFFHLAQYIFNREGTVIACKIDESGNAVHAVCNTLNELAPFLTSKYVQSQIGEMYIEADRILRQGRELLFVGTPCQVQGLLNFLREKKTPLDKLLAVDFICHGVPSPTIWKQYYTELTDRKRHGVDKISFRAKDKGWRNFSLKIVRQYGDEQCTIYSCDKEHDKYIRGFLNNLYLRPSCYSCRFKKIKHTSDLTLGDFWHFENCQSDIKDDNMGVSLVIAHSDKGNEILRKLKQVKLEEVPCNVISYANKNMLRSARGSEKTFFENYRKFLKKYKGNRPLHAYLSAVMKDSPAVLIKNTIKKVIGR